LIAESLASEWNSEEGLPGVATLPAFLRSVCHERELNSEATCRHHRRGGPPRGYDGVLGIGPGATARTAGASHAISARITQFTQFTHFTHFTCINRDIARGSGSGADEWR
jgi:hypothetical protein